MQHHSSSRHKEVHNLLRLIWFPSCPWGNLYTPPLPFWEACVLSPKSIDAENHTTRTLLYQSTPKTMPQELFPKSNDAEKHGKRRAEPPNPSGQQRTKSLDFSRFKTDRWVWRDYCNPSTPINNWDFITPMAACSETTLWRGSNLRWQFRWHTFFSLNNPRDLIV